ncbi:glycosyltransferase family 2 protein [Staphylococcus hominis]|uniref:glycosyltransferase family 2 protein n=2 Tax=Staphylococcus hominis TaxID=1290 RepID=UPI000989BC04|nr:glycosyltransferase family 2 protein [Staphylococcus hominis]
MKIVSIIIPTYNRDKKLIKRALVSVLKQTYQNFEIILVDDNINSDISNDVKKLVDELNDKRIKYIKNKQNIGGAKSRNKAIKIAKGDYITFLDDDDFYLKDKLKKQVDYLENNEFNFVISNLVIVNENYKIKDIRTFKWLNKKIYNNEELRTQHYKYHLTGTPTFIFEKTLLEDVEGFPDVPMGHEFHLVDNALRKNYKLGYIDDYFTVAVVHTGNRISTNSKRQTQLKELLNYKFKNLKNVNIIDKNRIYFRHYLASTSNYLSQNKKKKAIISALKALLRRPDEFLKEISKILIIKIEIEMRLFK